MTGIILIIVTLHFPYLYLDDLARRRPGRPPMRVLEEGTGTITAAALVRLDAVRAVHPWSHGDYHVELVDGTTVTWSRRYHAQERARFVAE